MIWGFAGPWYGDLYDHTRPDRLMARLEALAGFGIPMMSAHLNALAEMDEAEADRVAQFVADRDMHVNVGVGHARWDADADEARRVADDVAARLPAFATRLRSRICHTGAGAGHRFDRQAPVEEKLAGLSRVLAPVAQACKAAGLRLGIENHGDFYCSDCAELCRRTPDLHIFLDTGNTFLIGERPLPAYEVAAPYTIGGHFKDHRVGPNLETLHFELAGAVLGEGDAQLRACWDILLAKAPDPRNIAMEIEMIRPEGMDTADCLRRSLAFCQSLPEPADD